MKIFMILVLMFLSGCRAKAGDPNYMEIDWAEAISVPSKAHFIEAEVISVSISVPSIEIELWQLYVVDPNNLPPNICCYGNGDRTETYVEMRADGNLYLVGDWKDFIKCIYEGFVLDGRIFQGEVIQGKIMMDGIIQE